ncbi:MULTISPECIES: di-heme oxidoredictase family protein [unclassified Pseudomonas]|uniref:di-heme oxidoreductase family protein n=1 Tax=unclassified Pseudomonas TaxID=196821 RepID=UPI002446FF34|nr:MULTISPECIES: di-heme oxidoredictase family protein [unclassified Pseudomonas]MDH0303363.1 c-type cytochrome [Pseudomonas sp. GD04091]MDH1984570.1 c-type cytochrome [Pseudomonas sp. GD03689]
MLLGTSGHVCAQAPRMAFAQPMPGLVEDAQLERFFRGRGLFHQAWVIAPSLDTAVDGLGPLYNRITCIACHPRNGRGQAPAQPDEPMRSMLVRLSVEGLGEHGEPAPHPLYGDQLNEQGIPGVPGEGRALLDWEEHPLPLGDDETVMLRKPALRFEALAYGLPGPVRTSARVAPPVFGLGLLEAIEASTLQALADAPKPDGVKGRINQVWSVERKRLEPGRFGLKANQPDLRQQIASAMHGDLGITSPLYPQQNCTSLQRACRQAPVGGEPELDGLQLSDLHYYFAHLAVPARRDRDKPEVIEGERLFAALGCVACHTPSVQTGEHPDFPSLPRQRIEPYSDLLLHDMGEGLADGREDFRASGREWRTPPLWGLGLSQTVAPGSGYLHDGRARSLSEAILWHGAEAEAARERYRQLPRTARQALEAFLMSL